MIDWEATELSTGKTRKQIRKPDMVTVVCERCNKSRTITYNIARKKEIHKCMSCTHRRGEHSTGELLEHVCACGAREMIQYRIGNYENWNCQPCGLKRAHAEGKYVEVLEKLHAREVSQEERDFIGRKASEQWKNQEYRDKWSESRALTKDTRSATSKALWSDEERLVRLSATIKAAWARPDYREVKTEQSRKFWEQDDYKESQLEGMNRQEVRTAISDNSTKIWQDDVYRGKMAIARANQPRISSIQTMLYKYLDDLGVVYEPESEKTAIGHYVFDCLIPGTDGRKNLLIECQGDYWHSLPKAQVNDRSKFTYIDRYFPDYEIIYIWEHEFGAVGRVLDRLKQRVGLSLEQVEFGFSDVVLREPASKELRSFLDAYHYIGRDRGGRVVGAYLGGLLIGVVVYSAPLRQNTAGQFGLISGQVRELSRLCIHPSYHKRNFASWLISRSLRVVDDVELVIAYSDSTVGHRGTVYRAANFRLHHVVPPDYWYVDQDGFVMHKRTLYRRASRLSMSESDFAVERGYLKQWGGSKLCFVMGL